MTANYVLRASMTQERLLKDYIPALQAIEQWFQPGIPRLRQGKMIHIVLLRETRSYAIFTTEGGVLDTERLQAGRETLRPLSRVVMFKRKQIAAERRRGKELLREYGVVPIEDTPAGTKKGRGKEASPVACRLMDGV